MFVCREAISKIRQSIKTQFVCREADEVMATIRHDLSAVETILEESKAEMACDTGEVHVRSSQELSQWPRL